MEFGERRRSRKSPSFKLVSEQDYGPGFDSPDHDDTDSEPLDISENEAWLGDEGTEIKKQITGMMRLLSDKSGRGYQRVEREGEAVKEEPQEEALSWTLPQNQAPEEPQHCWSSAPPMSHSQYDTRSKTQKILNNSKSRDLARPPVPAATPTESSCCMCNCKSTLQAILLELRTMRKLMQTQRGAQEKQCVRKRRAVHRVTALIPPTKPATPPYSPCVTESLEEVCQKGRAQSERAVPSPPTTPFTNPTPTALYSLNRAQNCTEPEVQLAEDYEVFIPKAQLDSILLNYTRSGSLLFRKLVCAFFDDATLANSLPNGKRKRGLNDHRKGLDQNIVGAIKVFTEKYCTANRIEKLPGPRDWVQILQDQIKLARRRLKRAETNTDCDETLNRTPTDKTGESQLTAENGLKSQMSLNGADYALGGHQSANKHA
ncbi:BEN domain-containing protein 7 isoform X1 [Astyanax mexicanus]|uniref:BEN domain containing 7 n=2 Tax=Astyanax mexicanus TaxID=7994 RepID=A0A8B9RA67_ASTMX|nr:BEN domain-containing protein 7 isoform X1 [Astyanax mexicanus]KAG9273023.1 BEN domain-containing protein 7 isoform X1 [Astyanax mexicanus]